MKSIFSFPAACLFLFGCIAHPQMADLPLARERGELQLGAGLAGSGTLHASASYAPTRWLAVQAFGSSNPYGQNSYIQGAAGYFRPISEKGSWELYAGYGQGSGKARDASGPGGERGTYRMGYLQGNIGRRNTAFAHADFGMGIKAGILWADWNKNDNYEIDGVYTDVDQDFKRNYFVCEPQGMLRIGGKRLKFSAQMGIGWAFPLTGSLNPRLRYAPINLGLGASYRIGGK